jgi:hypothetical protein
LALFSRIPRCWLGVFDLYRFNLIDPHIHPTIKKIRRKRYGFFDLDLSTIGFALNAVDQVVYAVDIYELI